MAVPEGFAILTALAPVGTGVIGYWLSGRNDGARDRRAAEREAAARQAMREERLADERQAFQRDVLLELQDVLQEYMRAAIRISNFDLSRLRSTQATGRVPEDLDRASHESGIALTRVRARVLDDELRAMLQALHESATEHELLVLRLHEEPPDRVIAAIEAAQRAIMRDYRACTDRLGVVLRMVLGR